MMFLDAQRKLANLWFSLSAILLIALFFQIILGKYADHYLEVGSWLSQTILPTLSIISAALIFANQNRSKFSKKTTDNFYFKIVKGLSLFYFIGIYFLIIFQPIAYKTLNLSGYKVLQSSSLYLGMYQGILNAMLGIYFVKSA